MAKVMDARYKRQDAVKQRIKDRVPFPEHGTTLDLIKEIQEAVKDDPHRQRRLEDAYWRRCQRREFKRKFNEYLGLKYIRDEEFVKKYL